MSTQSGPPQRRITVNELKRMKDRGEKIAMVTAYDATAARLVAAAGVDVVLVGDSLGMVVQGHDSTLPVTLDQMVYHSSMVRRGLTRAEGTLKLTVDASGRVTSATAGEGDVGGSDLEACLKESSTAWRFPAADGEYVVDVPITVVSGGAKP